MNTRETESLVVTRVFPIDIQKLFRAWSDPGKMQKWLFPFPAGGSVEVENRFEVGGNYQLKMHNPDGDVHTMTGTYKEIIPNRKIVFTWNTTEVQDTVVTIELHAVDEGTELVLTHDMFPDADSAQNHTEGWEGCLVNLEKSIVQTA